MTRADRIAIAKYLRESAAFQRTLFLDPRTRRVRYEPIRAEIAQLRKLAKMLKEDNQ